MPTTARSRSCGSCSPRSCCDDRAWQATPCGRDPRGVHRVVRPLAQVGAPSIASPLRRRAQERGLCGCGGPRIIGLPRIIGRRGGRRCRSRSVGGSRATPTCRLSRPQLFSQLHLPEHVFRSVRPRSSQDLQLLLEALLVLTSSTFPLCGAVAAKERAIGESLARRVARITSSSSAFEAGARLCHQARAQLVRHDPPPSGKIRLLLLGSLDRSQRRLLPQGHLQRGRPPDAPEAALAVRLEVVRLPLEGRWSCRRRRRACSGVAARRNILPAPRGLQESHAELRHARSRRRPA